jgi:hypothetical protein
MRQQARIALCLILCCANALPVKGSPTTGGVASGRVQILVESVDLAAGEVL